MDNLRDAIGVILSKKLTKKDLFRKLDENVKKFSLPENKKITVTSDGTKNGTQLFLGNKEIKGLKSLSFSFWGSDTQTSNNISCSFERLDTSLDGFVSTRTYRLENKQDGGAVQEVAKIFKRFLEKNNELRKDYPSDAAFFNRLSNIFVDLSKYKKITDKVVRDVAKKNKVPTATVKSLIEDMGGQ